MEYVPQEYHAQTTAAIPAHPLPSLRQDQAFDAPTLSFNATFEWTGWARDLP
jgi:hypothetical protein